MYIPPIMVLEGAKAWIKREAREWAEAAKPRDWDDTASHMREVAKDWKEAAKTGGRDLAHFYTRRPVTKIGLMDVAGKLADTDDLEGILATGSALVKIHEEGFTNKLKQNAPHLNRARRLIQIFR